MCPKAVTAAAPATVANVGPGFDAFGFALEGPMDTVRLERTRRKRVRLVDVECDDGQLSRWTRKNVASAVVRKIWKDLRPGFGADVFLTKGLPLGSGMGSSAASAVAAAIAANALLDGTLYPKALQEYAAFGEKIACGIAHADNVAPALYGGFTIVHGGTGMVLRLPCIGGWYVTVVRPHIVIPTRRARKALPRTVSLSDHVAGVTGASSVVAGILRGDFGLFTNGVNGDRIVTPRRAKLIPMIGDVARAARSVASVAFGISGSGPAMFAVTDQGSSIAQRLGEVMREACLASGIDADVHVSLFGAVGAKIIKEET